MKNDARVKRACINERKKNTGPCGIRSLKMGVKINRSFIEAITKFKWKEQLVGTF